MSIEGPRTPKPRTKNPEPRTKPEHAPSPEPRAPITVGPSSGTAVAPVDGWGGFCQCLRKRRWPELGARSGRARRRRPKPERSSARRSTTCERANTAPARRSRRSRLACRRRGGPAFACRRRKMPRPRRSGAPNRRARLRNVTPVRRAGARAPRAAPSSMRAGAPLRKPHCPVKRNPRRERGPFDKLRARRAGAALLRRRSCHAGDATHRRITNPA